MWLAVGVGDSTPELSEMKEHPGALLSKVKLDHPQREWTPHGGVPSHTFLVTCSSGVGLIWLKEKEGSWRCYPPSEGLASWARTHRTDGK